MKKNITIKDVAKYAKVSVATVSNVLNNVDKASYETKMRVLEAVEVLEYHRNFTARSLVRQKSDLIGIIFSLSDKLSVYKTLMNNNPFYTEYISGIEYSARKQNYDVLITGVEDEKKCKEWILKRNIDGVIFLGTYSSKIKQELEKLQIPFALTDVYEQDTKMYNSIGIDDELGGYIATKHLIDLGHKHIAIALNNIDFVGVNYYRYEGYKKALAEVNITLNESRVFNCNMSYEGGYHIGQEIIKSKEKITAIMAVADVVAFGIIKALREAGKEIPKDYSLVGFDDLKECEYVSPGLTTIHQDIFQKGILTAEAVINEIHTGESINRRIELPLKLIVRESTRPIE